MKKKMVKKLGILLLLAGYLMFLVPVFATDSYPAFINEYLTNEPSTAITKDFNLPSSYETASVSWVSSNPAVIEVDTVNSKAIVHRPTNDTAVNLTATFNGTETKTFSFKVLGSGTTVYMSDNFYYPTLSGTPIQDTSLKYDAAIAKYYGYAVTNASGQYKMSIESNPGKANDYALKSNMATASTTYGDTTMYTLQTPPANGCVSVKAKMMSNSSANATIIKADSGSAGTTLFAIQVYAWGNNLYLSDNSTTVTIDAQHAVALLAFGTWFDIGIIIDFTHGKYTVSVGGNSLTMNLANQSTAHSLNRLSFSPYRQTASYLYVDDLVISKSVIGGTDEEALDAYKDMLTFSTLTAERSQYITKDINLDVLKEYSDAFGVTWSSSNTNALSITTSPTPKAVVHQIYNSQTVTLTATITQGVQTTTKSFDLTVRALGESIATFENFDDNTVDAPIPKSTTSQGWTYVGTNTTVTDSIVADANKGPVLRLDRNATTSGADGRIMRYFPWSGNPYGTRANGSFTSLACDLKFTQPEGIVGGYIMALSTTYANIAEIDFVWDGDNLQVMYSNGTTLIPVENISGDTAPVLGEWFRFEVKVNNQIGRAHV